MVSIIDYWEFEGYIESRGNEYPTLVATPKANRILFGNEIVVMKRAEPQEPKVHTSKKEKSTTSVDHNLFAELKALRRELADEKNVPAYIVFSDATLIDMCQKRPKNTEELLEVSGVGKVKLELYGDKFLQLLRAYYHISDSVNETEG